MSISKNLQQLMATVDGMNATRLARETGVPQPTIWRILRGESADPDTSTLEPLAKRFGKAVAQLRGEIPLTLEGVVEPNAPVARLPLISWVAAGMGEATDPYAAGAAESWEPFEGKFSGMAYCLRVKGDSMTAPPESPGPSFPDGTLIAVEPKMAARSGDFVVVRFNDTDEATFKQLVIDGPFKFLKPLNPRYNVIPIPNDAQLCGVVTESNLKRRFR
jgi:SOS-response transcriptional repressor LexA